MNDEQEDRMQQAARHVRIINELLEDNMAEDFTTEGGVGEQVPAVVVYRLTVLEREVSQIDRKLDSFISLYPSKELLDIMLQPWITKIDNLEKERNEEERAREQERSQFKLVLYAAVLSPVLSIAISVILGVMSQK